MIQSYKTQFLGGSLMSEMGNRNLRIKVS